MKTIRDWAEYYKGLKVWVCPHKEKQDNYYSLWKSIKTNDAYEAQFNQYNWEASQGITLVTGKKGSMVLWFKKDEDKSYSENSLQQVLKVLSLPKDYRWVIEGFGFYAIILDVHSTPSGRMKNLYKELHIEWENYFNLPSGINGYEIYFKYGIPKEHPTQISWSFLNTKIEEIDRLHLLVDNYVLQQRKKDKIQMILVFTAILICMIAAVTGLMAWLYDVSFEMWAYMFIFTLVAAGIVVWSMSS